MLESLTVFDKGGLVLYQHLNEASSTLTPAASKPSAVDDDDAQRQQQQEIIGRWIEEVYLDPVRLQSDKSAPLSVAGNKVVVAWEETADLLCVAVHPDIAPFPWIRPLLQSTLKEYQIFLRSDTSEQHDGAVDGHLRTATAACNRADLFDDTFRILFKTHKSSTVNGTAVSASDRQPTRSNDRNRTGKGGKEKRHWHDGKAKVTKEAMAELDFSKQAETSESAQRQAEDRALADARAAYLPTDTDLKQFQVENIVRIDDQATADSEQGWGNSLSSLFQQMTGNKVLARQDLQPPVREMQRLLTSKNVATDIAEQICSKVESQLVGKKLNTMYRVKTAVRQALESVISKLLAPSTQLDLIRQVVSKRDAIFGNKRPYVICVVGINGVGKSTTLAKIAYHLKTQGGCNPLLAACDTFRSGAVEQLGMHAKCLNVPIYAKGYSKDPSSVAKAAIEQAVQDKNDVVLIDTAGRMQNNVPLMKALGKLVAENKPDLTVFVGEALVGNDGVDQVRMFHQAISTYGSNRQKIDAIVLTKFDTVSDKVGAALSMTHVAPILFVGTGQKYHHLQKLSTQAVIQSLFR